MTPEETINALKRIKRNIIASRDVFCEDGSSGYYDYTHEAETCDSAIEYMQKCIAVETKANRVWNSFICPVCGKYHSDDTYEITTLSYCPHCGHALEIRWGTAD